jgi:hypothetical protein
VQLMCCDQQPKSSQFRSLRKDGSLVVCGRPPRPRSAYVCPLDNGGLRGVRVGVVFTPEGGESGTAMKAGQEVSKGKVGLLEVAKPLGNVSQACQGRGYRRESCCRSQEVYEHGGGAA